MRLSTPRFNGHEFAEIREGTSCMGSGKLDPFAGERERPMREIFVSTFHISRHATTFMQIAYFLNDTGQPYPKSWGELDRTGWPEILAERGSYPATQISWENAVSYCEWLSTKWEVSAGLPTEAEWEKAARGGDDRVWPWGDTFDPQLCNSAEKGDDICPVTAFEVGASPYGCLNMAGGVWEWCEDFYHAYSHGSCEFLDPVNLQPTSKHVVKGGSAFCTKEIVRPACRDWTNSYNQGGGDDGFRVCTRTWR